MAFVRGQATIGTLAPGRDLRITMVGGRARFAFEGGTTWTQSSAGATTVTAALDPSGRRLEVAGATGVYDRGTMRVEVSRQTAGRVEHVVDIGMEDYLLGLSEMPYWWATAALRAQAIAGRTFAEAVSGSQSGCTCTLYDSQRHQVYRGSHLQLIPGSNWTRWRNAVTATAGQILVDGGGRAITAFYSSSHGGVSQDLQEAWGSPNVSYVTAQDVSRWEQASASANSLHRWIRDRSAGALAADHDMTVLADVRVSQRTSQGRARQVAVTGWDTRGREVTSTTTREDRVRSTFGLPANYLDVRYTAGFRTRLAGRNRVETAVAASRAGWPDGADTVVVARADDPVDALGGVALAGRYRAPLLLTGSDGLAAQTADEVARLGAGRAFVLGGVAALSPTVVDDLSQAGVDDVVRVAGSNRFATMARVAEQSSDRGSGTAFIVRARGSGDTWADAMAISGVAARRATQDRVAPVLGVSSSGLHPATVQAIRDLDIDEVILVGGVAGVSSTQADDLRDLGLTVRRWWGSNRYLTSADIVAQEPGGGPDVLVVTGRNFPDGLAAGALAGRLDATLLVAPPHIDTTEPPWRDEEFPALLRGLSSRHDRVTALGGDSVVPSRTVQAVSWYLTPGAGAGPATTAGAAQQAPILDDTSPTDERDGPSPMDQVAETGGAGTVADAPRG